ncbi:MAG: hypothetical protein ABII68_03040 [Pseudomonadota bacterium]
MKNNFQKGILGRTGLDIGRLGLAASYGAPAEAFEEAFERVRPAGRTKIKTPVLKGPGFLF